ncbi:MAG: hypothetical protein ACFFDW_04095 [Candidatus Thorarchaeota archaeon]
MEIAISESDFKIYKKINPLLRLIIGFLLAIGGILFQLLVPINGLFPFEQTRISFVSFIIGFVLLILSVLLLFPERMIVSEEPKLLEDTTIWTETTLKQLSDVFNVINKRQKNEKTKIAFFDLSTAKGKWTFSLTIIFTTFLYLLILGLTSKLFASTVIFLLDIYLFIIPVFFIVRIKQWNPDILRKILFYHQFSKEDLLDDFEFTTSAGVQLQRIDDPNIEEELMLPINVRFMIEFEDQPESFDSLSIQITLNEYMQNKYPFFVCFLRMKKPEDWKPLKKPEATADQIVRIKHMVEDDGLHMLVLSKSPKAENPRHTSPREAAKIFARAVKMMRDFA